MDPFKPYQPKPKARPLPLLDDQGAEALALQAVAWIAADEALLAGFMAASGASPETLRQRLGERDFLAGALDYLTADETALLHFAEAHELPPEAPLHALARLSRPRGAAGGT